MTEFFTNLLAFGVALIPLLPALFTLLRNRTDKTNALLDTPALNIIKIIRQPVDDKVWNRTKGHYTSRAFLNIIPSLFLAYIILALMNYFSQNLNLDSYLYTAILLVSGFIGYILTIMYLSRYQNALQARYVLFKDIEILIESDYSYLFNKCLEGLKNLGTQIVEVNSDAHFLEACVFPFWGTSWDIKIEVKAVKDRDNCFDLQVELTENDARKPLIEISNFSEKRSKIINQFINQVINKPKNS